MSDKKPSIAELQQSCAAIADLELDPVAFTQHSDRIRAATAALLDIAAAALGFHERWQTADFEDDAKPARQMLFAALAKVRP